jgi:hypothetical protein
MSSIGQVYVIELERPLGSVRHQAQPYIGWALDIDTWLKEHQAGTGSAMLRFAVQQGIGFKIVASMYGDRTLERRLKNMKNSRKALAYIRRHTFKLYPRCDRELIRCNESICWYCEREAERYQQVPGVKEESDRVASDVVKLPSPVSTRVRE